MSGASKVEGTSSNPQGQSNTTNMTKRVDISLKYMGVVYVDYEYIDV